MDNQISFDDFKKLDIRIGTVTKAEVPPWSHWVTRLVVDFGTDTGTRTIFAGIMHFYPPDELKGRQFPFVINISPKKIGPEGDFSQGMLLAASSKLDQALIVEGEKVSDKPVLLCLTEKVPDGTKVT